MPESNSLQTPLFSCHQHHQARIVDFAGWQMPIQYEGILAEHHAVRKNVGVFDVSHMGRIEVRGGDALHAIQRWITNDASCLHNGQAVYSPVCYEHGGIVDDCIVYRLDTNHYLIVVNASNRKKDFEWFSSHVNTGEDVQIASLQEGDRWALLAVQGPKARDLLSTISSCPVTNMTRNQIVSTSIGSTKGCMIACTGYTGEDGFEVFVPADQAISVWETLFEHGQTFGIQPCGLGARDTLRMEMRYPLYGNDIGKETSPIEAGLRWCVKMEKGEFIGKDALRLQIQEKPSRRLVGFFMEEKGIPRHGYTLYNNDGSKEIGVVTSGGFAPSLEKAIGIGYVPAQPEYAKSGSGLIVKIRNKYMKVRVVKTPFFRP